MLRKPGVLRSITVTLALGVSTASAQTLYVDTDATGPNDGSSWCNAFLNVQDSLAVAAAGTTIRIADGTYKPDEGLGQTPGDRTATFQLISGITLEGGYAGCNAADPDERDPLFFETILTGDLNSNDLPGFGNYGDNSYHVVTASGISAVEFDGFTITGGSANPNGGGLLVSSSSIQVERCRFVLNKSGGGSEGGGSAISSISSTIVLNACIFAENRGGGYGGAIRTHWPPSSLVLEDCLFENNYAWDTGALYIWDRTTVSLTNCVFRYNYSSNSSGCISIMHGCCGPSTSLTNCLFHDNWTTYAGGAIYLWGASASPIITNCTFVGNDANQGGGIFMSNGARPTIVNSIFWENTRNQMKIEGGGLLDSVSYSLVSGGYAGLGNIDGDPRFLSSPGGNYRLSPGSPCIDAADNAGVAISTDLDGNARFVDDPFTPDTGSGTPPIVDMGVYEYVNQCGDGVIDPREDCDDGGESPTCDADCTAAECGDSTLNLAAGEECDDGAESTTCDSDCTAAVCGDGTLNVTAGETCDDGNNADCDGCRGDCSAVEGACGDGTLDPVCEVCDDGGESAMCDVDCTVSECGDGTLNVTGGEECDDGPNNSDTEPDACRTDCTAALCGDGVVDTGEECDDGNTESGDGCDENCLFDLGVCCVGTACSAMTEADCLNTVGSFFGFNSMCDAPDADGDGLRDECDECPDDPNKIEPGICGCGRDDNADSDGDGVPDCDDQCPGVDDAVYAPGCEDAIPTVSQWGMIVMALLLLTGAKVHFGRKRALRTPA